MSIIEINTQEYGTLKGEITELAAVSEIARRRHDAVKFLGIFDTDYGPIAAFQLPKKTVFTTIH